MKHEAPQVSFCDLSFGSPIIQRCNADVEAFRKQFHAIMKSKGFDRKTSIHSAMYTWEYTKGGLEISIDGWHGTGKIGTCRFWGHAKTLFRLYQRTPGARRYVKPVDLDNAGESYEVLLTKQQQGIATALQFARAL